MVSIDIYIEAISSITKEQSKIIGKPLALEIAQTVPGLLYEDGQFILNGDPKKALIELTNRYEKLLGKVAITVSEEAISNISEEALNEIKNNDVRVTAL